MALLLFAFRISRRACQVVGGTRKDGARCSLCSLALLACVALWCGTVMECYAVEGEQPGPSDSVSPAELFRVVQDAQEHLRGAARRVHARVVGRRGRLTGPLPPHLMTREELAGIIRWDEATSVVQFYREGDQWVILVHDADAVRVENGHGEKTQLLSLWQPQTARVGYLVKAGMVRCFYRVGPDRGLIQEERALETSQVAKTAVADLTNVLRAAWSLATPWTEKAGRSVLEWLQVPGAAARPVGSDLVVQIRSPSADGDERVCELRLDVSRHYALSSARWERRGRSGDAWRGARVVEVRKGKGPPLAHRLTWASCRLSAENDNLELALAECRELRVLPWPAEFDPFRESIFHRCVATLDYPGQQTRGPTGFHAGRRTLTTRRPKSRAGSHPRRSRFGLWLLIGNALLLGAIATAMLLGFGSGGQR